MIGSLVNEFNNTTGMGVMILQFLVMGNINVKMVLLVKNM